MNYCTKCGYEMEDSEKFCSRCGAGNHYGGYNRKPDKQSIGLNILSFFIPFVGLILFFIKRKEYPKKAKGILIWAIIGWVLWAFINIGGNSNTDSNNQASSIVTEDIISDASNGINNNIDTPTDNEQTTKAPETTKQPETVITYDVVDLQEMFDELDANALRAERTYQDKYIEVTGKLDGIDSDGKYITICALDDDWGWDSLHCSITNASQLDIVLEKNEGDTLTIKGQITDIGEVLGYYVDIHEIN